MHITVKPNIYSLTVAEIDLLQRVANGATTQKLMEEYNMTRTDISKDLADLRHKMGADTLAQAVSLAWEAGIFTVT